MTSSGVKLPKSSRSQHTKLLPQPTLELFSLEKCGCEMGCTLWLCQHSYWKLPVIVDFPMKNGGSFHSYVAVYQRVRRKWPFSNDILMNIFFLNLVDTVTVPYKSALNLMNHQTQPSLTMLFQDKPFAEIPLPILRWSNLAHLPSSIWKKFDPGSHRGWKMSFHPAWVIFRVYVNLPQGSNIH